jgi:hypothetical protein
MINCLQICESLAFDDSCVPSFREEGCLATLLRLAFQEQNSSREFNVVKLAICVGRFRKVPGKSSHLLAVAKGWNVACGALASVASKLGLQPTWLIIISVVSGHEHHNHESRKRRY